MLSGDDIIPFADPEFKRALLQVYDGSVHIDDVLFDYHVDIDTNKDGEISFNEAEAVEHLSLYDMEADEWFESLQISEIKYFTSLMSLSVFCHDLERADFSACPEMLYAYLNNCKLQELKLGPAIGYLECQNNNLTSLDVSVAPDLTYLLVNENQLASLDVSKNTGLVSLQFQYNQVSSIDISNCPDLEWLRCEENNLTTLEVGDKPLLSIMHCDNNQLTSLTFGDCPKLWRLYCSDNRLTSLDLSKLPSLSNLKCGNNPLQSLTISSAQQSASWLSDV